VLLAIAVAIILAIIAIAVTTGDLTIYSGRHPSQDLSIDNSGSVAMSAIRCARLVISLPAPTQPLIDEIPAR
jgi:hypothetical protein